MTKKILSPNKLPKKYALSHNLGKVTVICGPMFAGKSEEMLRILHRLVYANVPYLIFKPKIDQRNKKRVKSRDGRIKRAIEIKNSEEIFDHITKFEQFPFVVAIDEAQFLDFDLVEIVQILASLKIRVIIAGLDTDSNHQPFGPMGQLMAIADEVQKLNAVCLKCGNVASRTYRINTAQKRSAATVLIGDSELYEARCNRCHPSKPQKYFFQKQQISQWIKQLQSDFYTKHHHKEMVVKK